MVQGGVFEVFVEVDPIGGMSCGCSKNKHKIRYSKGVGVNDAKTTHL